MSWMLLQVKEVNKSRQKRVKCCLLRSSECMALQKYWNGYWESRGLRFRRTLSGCRILFIIAVPKYEKNIFFSGALASNGPLPPHYVGFTIALRHTPFGRTPLAEWSARCRDLYPTTQDTHKRQISTSQARFESTTPTNERPQTHALGRAATGFGKNKKWLILPYFSIDNARVIYTKKV